MKKTILLALLLLLPSSAYAQKTKAALTTEVNTNFASSSNITAATLRATVLDIINSYYDLNGTSTLSCAASRWVSSLPTLSSITCTQPGVADLTGFGTGVATALGINVGSAGAFVTFNGALGTPSSGTLTSATGLPISTGLTGAGTGVLTALGVNVGSAGAFVTFNGALGTPSSGTLTNATGLPYAGIASAAIASCAQLAAGTASTIVVAANAYCAETTTTFGSTTTFDFSTFVNTAVTLTANITTQTLSNVTAGKAGHIRFIQSGAGSFTTVWNSIFKFAGGATPTLTTGSTTAIDVLFFDCASATLCYASLSKDMK